MLTTSERAHRRHASAAGSTAPNETGESGEQIALGELDAAGAADVATRTRARQIAKRLAFARPAADRHSRRGVGDLASVRWNGGSDDLDLDATLDGIIGVPFPEDSDFVVREWVRAARSVVLVVDVSGSMKGERVRTAAATVGAMAGELHRDNLAVIAFWSDAAVLVRFGEQAEPLAILDLLLRVPTQGLTNVSFALEVARRQLAGVPARDSRVLLLSDCVHNAGPDPRLIATSLPRLDILLDTSGENDLELGRELAARGRGQCRIVNNYRQAAGALAAIFGD